MTIAWLKETRGGLWKIMAEPLLPAFTMNSASRVPFFSFTDILRRYSFYRNQIRQPFLTQTTPIRSDQALLVTSCLILNKVISAVLFTNVPEFSPAVYHRAVCFREHVNVGYYSVAE